ncbi:mannosyltransferase complex component [Scheffersomyces stipitis CBS 6054]|uniref:Mannosyltransferase complex component n=1 Tax=Scheffersomyces stipitis (strain ATCC 58785 / CBS 6054 / NBRC 10063 / NRRL Y-11545) TaxID=322104 RepID=A3LR87_PICST|nr:mannosyltransferase complex component [Scheffersomyces stipitis CBS 6054]ABN65697.2 mannosyltransferase complex component [Scheffersomyces stipitis CBS 6054]KAG2733460.1 hypothetical protein G9P44_002985 [Scheffersomyces stipitis]
MLGATFKPSKYGKQPKAFLPLPATFGRIHTFHRRNLTVLTIIVVVIWLFFNPFSAVSGIFLSQEDHSYPPPHPLTTKQEIPSSSRYLYPNIEHAPLLKQMTVHQLIKESRVRDHNFPEVEKTVIRSLNMFDDPNPIIQKQKEDEENAVSDQAKAKNYFKNQDKIVYRPSSLKGYPEVVIVTAVDFEKYSVDDLTKIVQNRVNYAHQHNYGIYVRWYQEFLPILNSLSYLQIKERAKWVRLYATRAAMHAFPHAKWFWYLDQDGLIMDLTINIQEYILENDALNPIMQREIPIIPPDGTIKTYKNARADSIKLIITQSDSKIESNSFLVKNDHIGRAMLETWGDPLYLTYPNFGYGPDSALTHILQWHPFMLSKTTIIPARTIASAHSRAVNLDKIVDKFHYFPGDFVVQWSDCETLTSCSKILSQHFSKTDKPDVEAREKQAKAKAADEAKAREIALAKEKENAKAKGQAEAKEQPVAKQQPKKEQPKKEEPKKEEPKKEEPKKEEPKKEEPKKEEPKKEDLKKEEPKKEELKKGEPKKEDSKKEKPKANEQPKA